MTRTLPFVPVLFGIALVSACASSGAKEPLIADVPLSAGKVREYQREYSAVVNAAREVCASPPRALLSEKAIGETTIALITRYRPGVPQGLTDRGTARVVVESRKPGVTLVRVFWPGAASYVPSTAGEVSAETLLFRAIEARLQ